MRVYNFGAVPPGLNQDEGSLAYDAFSLLHFGVERNGFRWPVMLIAFGSGMSGSLAAYLAMPFIALFGLTIVAARSVNVLFGSLSLLTLYLLLLHTTDRRTALLGTFLLAINPWHIMISRWGLDCNLFPAFFLLGILLLMFSLHRPPLLPLSFGIFALSLYTYGTSYVIVPAFLTLGCVYLWLHGKISTKWLLISGLVFAVLALPLGAYLIINQYDLSSVQMRYLSIPRLLTTPRYQAATSIFSSEFLSVMPQNLRVLWQVLWSQNDGLIWNAIPKFGYMYMFSAPFALFGFLVALWRSWPPWRYSPLFLVLLWFLVSIGLGAIMEVNINRINIVFLPIVIFLTLGIQHLRKSSAAFFLIIAAHIVSFGTFAHAYFTSYPDEVGGAFFESLNQAVNDASDSTDGVICVTDTASNMSEISVLFHRRINPQLFAQTVQYVDPSALYRHARSFGRYYFGLQNCANIDVGAYVVHISEAASFERAQYHMRKYKNYAVAIKQE